MIAANHNSQQGCNLFASVVPIYWFVIEREIVSSGNKLMKFPKLAVLGRNRHAEKIRMISDRLEIATYDQYISFLIRLLLQPCKSCVSLIECAMTAALNGYLRRGLGLGRRILNRCTCPHAVFDYLSLAKVLGFKLVCLFEFIVEVQPCAQIPSQYVCLSTEISATNGRFTELVPMKRVYVPLSIVHLFSTVHQKLRAYLSSLTSIVWHCPAAKFFALPKPRSVRMG